VTEAATGEHVDTQFTPVDRVLELTANMLVALSGLTETVDKLSDAVMQLHDAAQGGHK